MAQDNTEDYELIGISTDYWDDLRKQREQSAKPSWLGRYSTIAFSVQNTLLFLQSILSTCVAFGWVVIPWLYIPIVVISCLQAMMLFITNYRSYRNLFSELRGATSNFIQKFINKFARLQDFMKSNKEERWEIISDILQELLIINVVIYKTLGSAVASWQFMDSHKDSVNSVISLATDGKIKNGAPYISGFLVAESTPGVAIAQYSLFSRVNDRKHNYKVQRLLDETTDENLIDKNNDASKFSWRLVLCHFFAISYGVLDALLYSEALFRAAAAHSLINSAAPYLSPLFWVLIAETGVLFYGNYKSYLGLMKSFFFNPGPGLDAVEVELTKGEKFQNGFDSFIKINAAIFKTIGSALSAFVAIMRYSKGNLVAMIIFGALVVLCSVGVLFSNLALFSYEPMRKKRVTSLLENTSKIDATKLPFEYRIIATKADNAEPIVLNIAALILINESKPF